MKKLYTILCLAIASLTHLHAQAPQGFNYQATVRNSSGDLIINTNVYFKFNIIQGSQTAVPIFTETHYVLTDDLGQVTLIIGQGTFNSGIFSEIDWSIGSYFLGIELNTGNGYVAMGTTQLLSVPYALYAKNSGNTVTPTPNLEKVLTKGNSANNKQIKNLANPTDTKDAVTLEYLSSQLDSLRTVFVESINSIKLSIDNDNDGFTEEQGDCNDNDSTIYPGAFEIEGDGIDQNCDGYDDPPLLSINKEKFDINWNDVVKSKQEPYDINNDNIPDIISWQRINNQTVDPPIFYIKDYNGNDVWDFNIKEYNPAIRDSLNNLYFDYHDINNDGNMDFVLQYMGEWHNQTPNPDFYGINTYLLLSKGNLQYDVIEMFDDPDFDSFGIQLFDFDKDGNVDILHKSMQEGEYFKNINNQSFELSNINPLFISELAMKFDWNLDGEIDYVNLGLQNKTLTIVTSSENIVIPFDNTGWTFEFNIDGNPTSWSPERFSIIDGDNDGDWDFVIGGFLKKNNRNYYTQRYFENKNGSFSYIENFIETDHTLIGELQVYVDDIDGDGDDDLYYPFYVESQLNTPREDYGGNAYGPMFWWENTNTGFKINKKFELIY